MHKTILDLQTGMVTIVELTHAEKSELQESRAMLEADALARLPSEIRLERNTKLSASDWTQIVDSPVDKAAWVIYRQALRDVTAQAGFPSTIEWPVNP